MANLTWLDQNIGCDVPIQREHSLLMKAPLICCFKQLSKYIANLVFHSVVRNLTLLYLHTKELFSLQWPFDVFYRSLVLLSFCVECKVSYTRCNYLLCHFRVLYSNSKVDGPILPYKTRVNFEIKLLFWYLKVCKVISVSKNILI